MMSVIFQIGFQPDSGLREPLRTGGELKSCSVPGRHHVNGASEEGTASSAGTGRCPWSPSSNPAGKTVQSRMRTSPDSK